MTVRDTQLKTITWQKQLPQATHLAKDLEGAAGSSCRPTGRCKAHPHAHGHGASITTEPFAVQQSFFEDAPRTDPKREKLEQSLDAIRQKYGRAAIGAGSILKNDLGLGELVIGSPWRGRGPGREGKGSAVRKGKRA